MIRLQSKYCDVILSNQELQGKIAKSTHRSVQTIIRWAQDNSEMLTLLPVLQTVKSHLKISEEENITEHVENDSLVGNQ